MILKLSIKVRSIDKRYHNLKVQGDQHLTRYVRIGDALKEGEQRDATLFVQLSGISRPT